MVKSPRSTHSHSIPRGRVRALAPQGCSSLSLILLEQLGVGHVGTCMLKHVGEFLETLRTNMYVRICVIVHHVAGLIGGALEKLGSTERELS